MIGVGGDGGVGLSLCFSPLLMEESGMLWQILGLCTYTLGIIHAAFSIFYLCPFLCACVRVRDEHRYPRFVWLDMGGFAPRADKVMTMILGASMGVRLIHFTFWVSST